MEKIKLALGGGGISGLCHVGVISSLYDNNIEPCCIVGTSAGALFGSIYAALRTTQYKDNSGEVVKKLVVK